MNQQMGVCMDPRSNGTAMALPEVLDLNAAGPLANEILAKVGLSPNTYVRDLTEEEVGKLREVIERDYIVEGDLRRERANNIKRLMDIACYRGLRHRRSLPAHGQRTKTNARTRKGPKRTVGKQRKK